MTADEIVVMTVVERPLFAGPHVAYMLVRPDRAVFLGSVPGDQSEYPTGVELSPEEFATLKASLKRH